MATLVPDAVINAELQETVSRASIRRMIQGGSNILAAASETQRNQRLAEVRAAGIEPSTDNRIYVHRTDEDSIECYDGTSWRYVVPPSNIMVINGMAYKTRGYVQRNATFNTPVGSEYQAEIDVTMPIAAPPGWRYIFSANGFTFPCYVGAIVSNSGASHKLRILSPLQTDRATGIHWTLVNY